ncbi:MAG: hypothetical protein ACLRWQ_20260 [Flavonifractor plautii]
MRVRVLHLPEVLSGHTEDGAAAEALSRYGYEIHMGTSVLAEARGAFSGGFPTGRDGRLCQRRATSAARYVHGIFDEERRAPSGW